MEKNVFEEIVDMAGDNAIDTLYIRILEHPNVWESFDPLIFTDTPLHLAAAAGNIELAIEIMRLKPSFALKLNQQGLSPIHVALVNNHINLVRCIVAINKDLVRVKGKKGLTPLHFVCDDQVVEDDNNISLLIYFLDTCPDSMEDVNVRGETALHIAVRSGKFRAFRVLVCWLRQNRRKGASHLEISTLNKKDNDGNTILHILAGLSTQEGLEGTTILLQRSKKLDKNAKNTERNTALDLATDQTRGILMNAGARLSEAVPDANYEHKLISAGTPIHDLIISSYRVGNDVSSEERSIYMVVVSLLVTAVYQSTINPPGGVYPADNALNNTTSPVNSSTALPGKPGTSILGYVDFDILTLINMEVLFFTVFMMFILMPKGTTFGLLCILVFGFSGSYLYSVILISPNSEMKTFSTILICIILSIYIINLLYAWVKTKKKNHP